MLYFQLKICHFLFHNELFTVIIKAVDKKAINPLAWFSVKLLGRNIWNLQATPNLNIFEMQGQLLLKYMWS